MFPDFLTIFPNSEYKPRFELLEQTINSLEISKYFSSIIDMDVYLFGLMYLIVFENKTIDVVEKTERRMLANRIGRVELLKKKLQKAEKECVDF